MENVFPGLFQLPEATPTPQSTASPSACKAGDSSSLGPSGHIARKGSLRFRIHGSRLGPPG